MYNFFSFSLRNKLKSESEDVEMWLNHWGEQLFKLFYDLFLFLVISECEILNE